MRTDLRSYTLLKFEKDIKLYNLIIYCHYTIKLYNSITFLIIILLSYTI